MLVDSSGGVVITNDGATILQEMDIEHPAAQMIVEVAGTQEEVGDGTTTAAVLTGELLARAEKLLEQEHHATVVLGYHEAARLAGEAVHARVLDLEMDDGTLRRVAESSITGKGTGDVTANRLAELVLEAVRHVADESVRADRDHVHVHTRTGASSSATRLVEGALVDEEPANDNMPRAVEDAGVALLDTKLEVRKGEIDGEYTVTSADQLDVAIEAEDREPRGYAATLSEAGLDVVSCTKKIDDRVASFLVDAGTVAYEPFTFSYATALARATGAKRLGSLSDFEAAEFGHADAVDPVPTRSPRNRDGPDRRAGRPPGPLRARGSHRDRLDRPQRRDRRPGRGRRARFRDGRARGDPLGDRGRDDDRPDRRRDAPPNRRAASRVASGGRTDRSLHSFPFSFDAPLPAITPRQRTG
jgi:chaperonin GroEL (HSP60 family)